MTIPTVSIMMPAYNAAAYIHQAIESILAQTFAGWELVIVDDGSTDNTYEIAAAFHDPRIRIIRQENGGESVARNTALAHMRGKLVAFLDSDDLFLPDHLALTTTFLQDNPHYQAVYTDGYYCNTEGQRLKPLSADRRGPFTGDIFEQVVRASDVFGPPTCVVMQRDLIEQHQLRFDPQIVIGPDWDFMTAYSEHARFGHIDAHTCLYRVHETNVTLRVDRQRRALYLARCREKAIQRLRFAECSLDTRREVFYDLLIEQLTGHAARQETIITWPQFQALPPPMRATLLRLMAVETLVSPDHNAPSQSYSHIASWLQQARRLNRGDWRNVLFHTLYRLNPSLLQRLLIMQRKRRTQHQPSSPFASAAPTS